MADTHTPEPANEPSSEEPTLPSADVGLIERVIPSFPRLALVLVGAAAAWITLNGARELKSMIAPTLLALTLVITVYPLIGRLRRVGVPAWLAALAALLMLYLVVALLFASLAYAVAQLAFTVPKYSDQLVTLWQSVEQWAQKTLPASVTGGDGFSKLWEQITPGRIVNVASGLFSTLSGGTSLLLLVLTVMIFMVMDAGSVERRMEILRELKPRVADGLGRFSQGVRSYWLVTTVFGLIVAVIDYFALVIIGVPLAMTWALVSFVTNYIPNVGFVIGVVPPALLALVDKGTGAMIAVVVSYTVINFVIQTLIQPRVTGDTVGISATASFLSLVFWAWVLGPIGALLAVPMTLMVKALLLDVDPNARWGNALLANSPEDALPLAAVQASGGPVVDEPVDGDDSSSEV